MTLCSVVLFPASATIQDTTRRESSRGFTLMSDWSSNPSRAQRMTGKKTKKKKKKKNRLNFVQ